MSESKLGKRKVEHGESGEEYNEEQIGSESSKTASLFERRNASYQASQPIVNYFAKTVVPKNAQLLDIACMQMYNYMVAQDEPIEFESLIASISRLSKADLKKRRRYYENEAYRLQLQEAAIRKESEKLGILGVI